MSVCLSLSDTAVETAKRRPILTLFSPWGSHIIPVFPFQTVWQHSDGNLTP